MEKNNCLGSNQQKMPLYGISMKILSIKQYLS